MLNLKIKDYSRKGVVLFFCVFAVGILLRYFPSHQSATSSEIDQLYFSQNLNQIFFLHNQTIAHFLLSKIWLSFMPMSVHSLRVMMMAMSFWILWPCTYLLFQKKSMTSGLIFFTAWWLWPVNIMTFDMVPIFCLLVLFLWFFRPTMKPVFLWLLLAFLQMYQPLILLLVVILVSFDWGRKKIAVTELRFLLSTTLPMLIYFAVGIATFGLSKFKIAVPSMHFFFFLVPLCFLVFQKREASYQHLYGVLVVLLIYDFLVLKLWNTYPGDDEAVAAFKTYTSELYERPVVICATIPQQDYYFKLKHDCQFEVLKHQLAKQEFYYFDLSGTRSDLVGFLKKNAPHVEEKKFHHATFLSVSY